MHYQLLHGDNREQLKHLADNSIDSIVCDPPYELGFMGKRWDSTGIAYDGTVWAECLRVLKPGGHLIAFGGTRTYHRMTVAIEDAGFEIRDCIMWLYGSGFPKSHDVSKALDKQAGAEREVIRERTYQIANDGVYGSTINTTQPRSQSCEITAPATDLAKQWHGYGTALKPAVEPAVLARKPLIGTVADNVTTWGVGGINVDGCRVGDTSGRWPANVILDESAGEALDEQSGWSTSNPRTPSKQHHNGTITTFNRGSETSNHSDSGGASRFFYNVRSEYTCPLCYNTYVKDMTTEELCKNIFASSVENLGWTTREINEYIAHVIALLTQNAQLVQNVKSVIPRCDLCATSIAVVLAETKTSGFNQHLCARTLDYMPRFANSILTQSLASFAELWVNTDIIPTTQSLSMLYGSALHAIENYIKQGNEERAAVVSDRAKETRFLYTAKASKAEREAGLNAPDGQRGNIHATVKPIALMRYLVRLVTPKDGTVLDPFMGSGSTGCAAMCEGVNFVGIELSEEYLEIARRRIEYWREQNPMGL